jgi:hypothetical protein
MRHAIADDGTADKGPGRGFDGGENGLEPGTDAGAGHCDVVERTVKTHFGGHPGDPVGVLIEGIETQLVGNKKSDEDTTGEADGQPKNIDEGKCFFPEKVSEGEFKVIAKHI